MNIDLGNIEPQLEEVLDTVVAAVPGNPALAVPAEKAILHGLMVGLMHLLAGNGSATASAAGAAAAEVKAAS